MVCMFILRVCSYCVYVHTACMFILRVCSYCVYVHTACMFILRVCSYCVYVHTACMFILPVCSYYVYVHTTCMFILHVVDLIIVIVHVCTCSILVGSFRVIFCLTLILVNPFLSVCHSAARGQTITQRLKTYTPSKRVSSYITSTRDTPLCTRVSEHSGEHAFSGSEHSIKAFSDHLLYSTPAALTVGCSQQLLIIRGRV